MIRYRGQQMTEIDGETLPLLAGMRAIFGHGNVSGMREALHVVRDSTIDFVAHGRRLGAEARKVASFSELDRPSRKSGTRP